MWEKIKTCPEARRHNEAWPVLVWHVFQGVMVSDTFKARDNPFHTYWQEIDNAAWIDCTVRFPGFMDADEYGCVIGQDKWGNIRPVGWRVLPDQIYMVRWMPPPRAPKGGEDNGELYNDVHWRDTDRRHNDNNKSDVRCESSK